MFLNAALPLTLRGTNTKMTDPTSNEFEVNFEAFNNFRTVSVNGDGDSIGGGRAPKRYLRDVENPLELFTTEEFYRRYRFHKNTVCDIILPLIETGLEKPTRRGLPIPPLFQLLITLRFYATGHFMVDEDLFKVSQGTESRIVKRVSVLLAEHGRRFIRFPDDLDQVQRDFRDIAGFPGIVGCVDTTYVPIKHPGGDHPEVYKNGKGVFSLNVQICCGPNYEIYDIVARHPGSTEDSTVFGKSALRLRLRNGLLEGIVLGDAGYPAETYFLTPLRETPSTQQNRYNVSHNITWKRVRKTFSRWKRRFPCLKRALGTKLVTTTAIIVATAVLNNIHRRYECTGSDQEESDEDINEEAQGVTFTHPTEDPANLAFREDFIERYF